MHERAGFALAKVGRGGPRHVERPLEVHADDRVPVVLGHLVEDDVTQDPRVVDDPVEAPEIADRLRDHALGGGEVRDRVEVGHRLAAGVPDPGHHFQGGHPVAAFALFGSTEVVHDHLRAVPRGEQRDVAPDPPARAGDQDDLAFEHPFAHVVALRRDAHGAGGARAFSG